MKKYLLYLSVPAVIIALLILILAGRFECWQESICWYVLAYFFVVTFLSHLGLERSMKARPQAFVRYYMASTSLRLLAHLIVIIIFAMFNQSYARFFIITFMIMYFVFTAFEVAYVMRNKV
jgi:hypothetical protein